MKTILSRSLFIALAGSVLFIASCKREEEKKDDALAADSTADVKIKTVEAAKIRKFARIL